MKENQKYMISTSIILIKGEPINKKIIRVTGKGQISVPPDRIRLLFELEERIT